MSISCNKRSRFRSPIITIGPVTNWLDTLWPSVTGFSSVTGNLPAVVRNTGLEVSVTSRNVSGKLFSWTSGFSLTVPRNRLIAYPHLAESSYANIYAVGQSLFIQKRLHYTSVDPTTGIYRFADVNGNGSDLDYPQDLEAIKQVAPRYYGGLQNSLGWGHWQLDFFIQFVQQTGFTYLATSITPPGMFGNQPTAVTHAMDASKSFCPCSTVFRSNMEMPMLPTAMRPDSATWPLEMRRFFG